MHAAPMRTGRGVLDAHPLLGCRPRLPGRETPAPKVFVCEVSVDLNVKPANKPFCFFCTSFVGITMLPGQTTILPEKIRGTPFSQAFACR